MTCGGFKVEAFSCGQSELPTRGDFKKGIVICRDTESQIIAIRVGGGDIANGWVDGDNVVCPWHNLPFSTKTGASNCKSLAKLRMLKCKIDGDTLFVNVKEVINAVDAQDLDAVTDAMAAQNV